MIDLSSIGTVRPDGSILIDNTNVAYREAMTGDYQRIRQTPDQNFELSKLGFQTVQSSFISGVGVFGDDLRIRFHNGSVYEYYGFADKFEPMLRSNSKGQYFNRNIRPTKRYSKISNIDFSGGNVSQLSDVETFTNLDTQMLSRMFMMLQGSVITTELVKLNGVEHQKFNVDGLIFYRPTQV